MSAKPEILIVGAGGHACVLIGIIRAMNRYRIKGLLNERPDQIPKTVFGEKIIGSWKDLERLRRRGVRYTALAVGDNAQRATLKARLDALGFETPALIHPETRLEPTTRIDEGAVVCLGAMIGAGAHIGEGALVNTGSIIDHETVLQPFVHVAPGCAIAGRVIVGTGTFIGIGSLLIDHITVGSWSVIGAGSVVLKNIPDRVTAFGVPARVHKKRR